MTEEKDNTNEQDRMQQNQNQSLRDAGAAVPDYGKAAQEVREQSKERTKEEDRTENASNRSIKEEEKQKQYKVVCITGFN